MSAGADEQQPGVVGRVLHVRPVRAYLHYSANRGNVLAGGVAFVGLFSLVSLLVVAVSVLGLLFGSRPALQDEVYAQVNAAVPNLLQLDGPDSGLLDPSSLLRSDVLSVTGGVALLVALVTGLGWLDALREGIRSVFTEPPDRRPFLAKKGRDLLVLLTLGLVVLVSGSATVVVGAAAGPLLQAVGLQGSTVGAVALRVATFAVVAALDTAVFLLLFRVLSDLRLPVRDVRQGAVVGGVALALITTIGGALLQLVGGNNPVVAASATLGAILVWLNLLSRVTLVAAAWAATTAEDAGSVRLERREDARGAQAPREDLDVPAGPRPRAAVAFDQRTTDRTTLAAGALLGVVGAGLVTMTTGAVRAVVHGLRDRG
ncbi:YihY/virulence factor BrkB family protein [uncultured Pseudokineococcus sp.]|uniref:YihY/virulence factor BrkB family protein n=1 Tax=uncultured Pseudokineococcus sp. TaxID=1642928 RepID=UPI002610AAAD|nr:YhjD/YihY/BrkB family envelope integrity protein [uncultured Pseudokineococcus sp.]